MRRRAAFSALFRSVAIVTAPAGADEVRRFNLPQRDYPHDVAPAPDGTIWYTE